MRGVHWENCPIMVWVDSACLFDSLARYLVVHAQRGDPPPPSDLLRYSFRGRSKCVCTRVEKHAQQKNYDEGLCTCHCALHH